MGWSAITEAHIKTRLSGPELDAFREAALGDGQDDPVDDIVEQITGLVRGYVAGNQTNTLGPTGTVPDMLIGAALDLILIEIQTRAAGMLIDPEDVRKEKARNAYRLLENVAAGKVSVDSVTTAGESQKKSAAAIVRSSTPRATRANMKGF